VQRQERWRSKLYSVLGGEFCDRDIERLLAGTLVEPFPRRALLYSPGDISEQIYLLLAGVVTLAVVAPDGARVVLQLLRSGAFFGYSAFLPSRERQFQAEALTDVEVAAVSRDHFLSVFSGMEPSGQAALLARVADTIGRLGRRQMALVALPVEERLINVLEELSADFGVEDARGTIIDLRLTQETLAALAGASRQRVNAALSELTRQNCLSRDGRRIVLRQRQGPSGPGGNPARPTRVTLPSER
jgi:CRP-like cAMP-binding protein